MKNKNEICHASYLRNHTSYDCHLWYTCVKWQYFQVFYSFFQNFDFLVVREVRGQKTVQNDKKSVRCTPYLRNRISYDLHLWYTCFRYHWGGMIKGQKMAQNDRKFCLSYSLSQEPHIIDFWCTCVK